jgi:hypothetical protein
MLFRALDTYLLSHTTARAMPHLANYIETLNVRRELQTERTAAAAGYESNLVRLLRKILADAEIETLLRKAGDLDCYFDVLVYTVPRLNGIFDPVTTGLTFHDMAIRRSAVHTEEFFIPVACQDPVSDLPFDQGWDAWRAVKPLRLVDLDSLELTFATWQDQIVFSKLPPARAVMTIDVAALVLQYIAFLREHDQALAQPEYLHRYVLIHLLQDLEDLWLANVYGKLLARPSWFTDNPQRCIAQIIGDTRYGFPGSELAIALQEVAGLIATCRGGAVTPAVLLQSLRLSDGNIPGFLETLIATTATEDQRQGYWVEYLRDMHWLTLMYDAYQLQPEFVATQNLRRNLKRDIPILMFMHFANNARSPAVRQFIEQDLKTRLAVMG